MESVLFRLVLQVFAVYAVTFVLADSHLLETARAHFNLLVWRLGWEDVLIDVEKDWSFISCRMCVGFWVSLTIILIFGGGVLDLFAVYGASYFLATQER